VTTATVAVNGLAAKSILTRSGAALSAGDITAGKPITLCYDGTQFIIQGDGNSTPTEPGLVLVEQHTASVSASLDFTTCITSTYDEYQIELIHVRPATNNSNLYLRMSTDGGATYDSTNLYGWANWAYRATASGVSAGGLVGQIDLTPANVSNSASWGGASGTIKLFNPLGSYYKQYGGKMTFFGESEQYLLGGEVVGYYQNASPVNAFRFLYSAGNITSGTIRCYGIKK
jgi:hypothetical protein